MNASAPRRCAISSPIARRSASPIAGLAGGNTGSCSTSPGSKPPWRIHRVPSGFTPEWSRSAFRCSPLRLATSANTACAAGAPRRHTAPQSGQQGFFFVPGVQWPGRREVAKAPFNPPRECFRAVCRSVTVPSLSPAGEGIVRFSDGTRSSAPAAGQSRSRRCVSDLNAHTGCSRSSTPAGWIDPRALAPRSAHCGSSEIYPVLERVIDYF